MSSQVSRGTWRCEKTEGEARLSARVPAGVGGWDSYTGPGLSTTSVFLYLWQYLQMLDFKK